MTTKSVHSNKVLTQLVLRIKDHKMLNRRTGFLYFAFALNYSLLDSTFKINKLPISQGFLRQVATLYTTHCHNVPLYPGLNDG